jgi:hypothetical protein
LIEGTDPQRSHQRCGGIDDFACVGQRFADGDNAPFPDPDISLVGFACGGNRTVTNDGVERSHGRYFQQEFGSVGCDHATC